MKIDGYSEAFWKDCIRVFEDLGRDKSIKILWEAEEGKCIDYVIVDVDDAGGVRFYRTSKKELTGSTRDGDSERGFHNPPSSE